MVVVQQKVDSQTNQQIRKIPLQVLITILYFHDFAGPVMFNDCHRNATLVGPSKQKTSDKPLPLPNLLKESEPFAFPQRWWLSVQLKDLPKNAQEYH